MTGICCSGAGTSCVAGGYSIECCSPLACTGDAGAQTCGTCLDPDNSGPGKPDLCSSAWECCGGAGLTCDAGDGQCCKTRETSCVTASECCGTDTCGSVTKSGVTQASVCCGDFQSSCGYMKPCCDGYVCSGGTCLKAPQQPCGADVECASGEGCKIATPPTGQCCLHESETCASDADCCTGKCDPAFQRCQSSQPYQPCLADGDCAASSSGFAGQSCGGNANVGPLLCCPAPGQACGAAADCCEAGDSCSVPLTDASSPALCCHETQVACAQDKECCTGACYVGQCCGQPYMETFVCASDADCCTSGTPSTNVCDTTATPHARCCITSGRHIEEAIAWQCCSGRAQGKDPFASCQ